MNYTTSQLRAITTHDSNLQIIACAGSGKTQVISARIVEILKNKKAEGITPANMVAFTFTDKAAGELKDRIHRLARALLGTDQGLAEMFIGTIHGYCLNLLQSPPLYKFLKYSVLTDIQQRLLIDRNSTRSGLTETPLLSGGTLKRWADSRLYQQVLSIMGEGDLDPHRVPPAIHAAVNKYYELLDSKRYLDYTMIIAHAVAELTQNIALRAALAAQVKYLVVDEYQDVNPLQEMLVRQLHDLGANLCVVGDDNRTIYQWRGSEVRNIIQFATRYPGITPVALNENFRSSNAIVESARRVVEQNPERLSKRMEGTAAQTYPRGDLLALTFDQPEVEAHWLAQKITALIGLPYRDKPDADPRGLTYSDIAILMRVWKDARPIIQLVTALYTVIFGILAFAANPVPAYLARTNVRILGLIIVLSELVALLAALAVVIPSAYHYASASQTQRQAVFDSLMRRKSAGLRVALIAFGVGAVAFAALFVVVLFGL